MSYIIVLLLIGAASLSNCQRSYDEEPRPPGRGARVVFFNSQHKVPFAPAGITIVGAPAFIEPKPQLINLEPGSKERPKFLTPGEADGFRVRTRERPQPPPPQHQGGEQRPPKRDRPANQQRAVGRQRPIPSPFFPLPPIDAQAPPVHRPPVQEPPAQRIPVRGRPAPVRNNQQFVSSPPLREVFPAIPVRQEVPQFPYGDISEPVESQPNPRPPQVRRRPEPRPARRPAPRPARRPAPRPAPRPERRPAPRPERRPAPRPERRPAPRPVRRPAPRPAPRPARRPSPRPAPRPVRRPVERYEEPAPRPAPRPVRRPVERYEEPAPRPAPRPARRPVERYEEPAPQPVPRPAPAPRQTIQPIQRPIYNPETYEGNSAVDPIGHTSQQSVLDLLNLYYDLDPKVGVLGQAGADFPTHAKTGSSKFNCNGRARGYYADAEKGCQVYYHCDERGNRQSFLCNNGTIFNQRTFVCEWWYNVNCGEAEANYFRNDLLHLPPKESSDESEDDYRGSDEDYRGSDEDYRGSDDDSGYAQADRPQRSQRRSRQRSS